MGIALLAMGPRVASVKAAVVPPIDHVFVIVMENHSYGQVIGSASAPYINRLVPSGGLATNYYAVSHPSLPNYLAMAGGTTYGITSDCTTCWVSAPNIADNIEAAGKRWKAYQESMPAPCFIGDSYPYVQKHNPFVYFNDIRTNTSRCQSHIVPYSQLRSDLASASTTPNYSFITPNICNDMHDCAVTTGDSWLGQQVPQILASPAFTTQRSLLAIVWDEDDSSGANQVPLILLGSGVSPNFGSPLGYNHYSMLRTLEAGLGLPTLTTNDGGAATMNDFFGLVGWQSLGGILTSRAAVASRGSSMADVVVRGTDNGLYMTSWQGAAWSSWTALGGILTSSPAVVSANSNQLDVFVRGTDNALWQRRWDASGWHSWQQLGGILTSGPDVTSWGGGRLDVFVRGTDNGLWHRWYDVGTWSSWESLGGVLTSDPAVVAWSQNRLDVFVRGSDNALYHRAGDTTGWHSWERLGGMLTTAPAASSCTSGHLDVFVLGSDYALYRLGFNGSWAGWQRVGGTFTSSPGAACRPTTTSIDVAVRGHDSALWQTTATGS